MLLISSSVIVGKYTSYIFFFVFLKIFTKVYFMAYLGALGNYVLGIKNRHKHGRKNKASKAH